MCDSEHVDRVAALTFVAGFAICAATWAQPAIFGNRIFIKDAAWLTLWTIE